jgi:RNA polymerase sigma-70 factor (ECF subfamily)
MEAPELTALIRRNAGLIHRVAYAYCRDPAEREEVIQEVALQLWRSRASYDPLRRESTWVYRIAINVAISFQRRERRHREGRVGFEAHAVTIAAAGAPEPSAEVQLLLACVDELGALEKALVLLHLDDNDHASIAEVLGISVSNVGTKLGRIKDRLRDAMERRLASQRKETRHADR